MYQKSTHHIQNAMVAQKKATEQYVRQMEEKRRAYALSPTPCLHCGKGRAFEKRGETKFCSKSCSASFNNSRRRHSAETRAKIQKSVRAIYGNNPSTLFVNHKSHTSLVPLSKRCADCGVNFSTHQLNTVCCSPSCAASYSNKKVGPERKRVLGQQAVQKQMASGRWRGWSGKGADKASYPEQFTLDFLEHSGISGYAFQHQQGRYCIDFAFIDKKVALEIDGKQHHYPQNLERDARRDEFLKSLGWKVYRIDWVPVRKTGGREKMIRRLESFAQWLALL